MLKIKKETMHQTYQKQVKEQWKPQLFRLHTNLVFVYPQTLKLFVPYGSCEKLIITIGKKQHKSVAENVKKLECFFTISAECKLV